MEQQKTRTPQLFLDADGVLADFDHLAEKLFGMPMDRAEQLWGSKFCWDVLERYDNFYGVLPLMKDALELVEATKHLNPIILTGCPNHPDDWSRAQKLEWGQYYFPELKMICCPSPDKRDHITGPGDILVDDRPKYAPRWEQAGGIFIHHKSAAESIARLTEMGVL